MKRAIWILLLAGMAVTAYSLLKSNKYKSGNVSINDFSYKDTAKLTRVELSDRDGNSVTLVKRNNQWMVNDEYPAFQPNIDILLGTTLSKIMIKGPVPKTARDNVIRSMISRSIHVKLYEENDLVKSYYVGGSNPAQTATYLHIEGAETPYLGYIPGFTGILYPKFSTKTNEWYNRIVFDYDASDIESISIKNNETPNESFLLSRVGESYTIEPPLSNFSQAAARSYFSLFKFKNFEGFAEYIPQSVKDSIKSRPPYLEIEVFTKNGNKKMKVYRKGQFIPGRTLVDKNGDEIVKDVHRYFATFDDFKYLVTIQDYTFGKILIPRSYFKE